jgi:ferrous iron transport protein A
MTERSISMDKMKVGESAVIVSFTDEMMSLKLLEMGCIPGEIVILERKAPLGDPIAISVSGYLLSLRMDEAATIMVSRIVINIKD